MIDNPIFCIEHGKNHCEIYGDTKLLWLLAKSAKDAGILSGYKVESDGERFLEDRACLTLSRRPDDGKWEDFISGSVGEQVEFFLWRKHRDRDYSYGSHWNQDWGNEVTVLRGVDGVLYLFGSPQSLRLLEKMASAEGLSPLLGTRNSGSQVSNSAFLPTLLKTGLLAEMESAGYRFRMLNQPSNRKVN